MTSGHTVNGSNRAAKTDSSTSYTNSNHGQLRKSMLQKDAQYDNHLI